MIQDFCEGQWWIKELDDIVKDGTPDQKRAVYGVVRALMREHTEMKSHIDAYCKEAFRKEALYFRWLTSDIHSLPARTVRNDLLTRMGVMSYSAVCAAIKAAMDEQGDTYETT